VDLLQELAGSGAAVDAQLIKSAGVLGAAARTHSNGRPAESAWEFVGRALAARSVENAEPARASSGPAPSPSPEP
jgi:hypothetical protein